MLQHILLNSNMRRYCTAALHWIAWHVITLHYKYITSQYVTSKRSMMDDGAVCIGLSTLFERRGDAVSARFLEPAVFRELLF